MAHPLETGAFRAGVSNSVRSLSAAVIALVLTAALAACGGSGDSGSGPTGGGSGGGGGGGGTGTGGGGGGAGAGGGGGGAGGGGGGGGAAGTYIIGGSATGLAGSGLTLTNGNDTLKVTASGAFSFPTALASAASYNIAIASQPTAPSQTCTVTNGSGTVNTADVTDVAISCTTNAYSIGGTVTGLAGTGLTLRVNGGTDLPVTADGKFVFQPAILSGTNFSVSVLRQPRKPGQLCTIAGDTGVVADSDITSVAITCQVQVARFVYAVNTSENTVGTLAADASTGQLRNIGYLGTGWHPLAVTLSADARFAYVLDSGQLTTDVGDINVFPVSTNGLLTSKNVPIGGQVGVHPTNLVFDPSGHFVYVPNLGSGTVSAFAVDTTTGSISPVPGSPFATGSKPVTVAVDPKGRFAYVANSGDNTLTAYRIDPNTGALTEVAGERPTTALVPASMAIDPSGRFLYVACFEANAVSMYVINSDGSLGQLGSGTVLTGNHPDSIAIDPSGQFVYVANRVSDTVSIYGLDLASGNLSHVDDAQITGGNPLSVNIDPSGAFAYVRIELPNVNAKGHANAVATYDIDASTGKLTLGSLTTLRADTSSPVSLGVGRGTTPLAYAPQRVYVVSDTSNTVSQLNIIPTSGKLGSGNMPVTTGGVQASSVVMHPSRSFLYALNTGTGDISTFSVDARGALTSVGSRVLGGSLSRMIRIECSGRYLYVAYPGMVAAFSINSITGVPTRIPVTKIPQVGGSPEGIVIDPTGRFLYVSNYLESTVSGFVIDSDAGTLTSVGLDTPLPANANPRKMAIDPAGRHLYVTNSNTANISVLSIDPATGVLTPSGSPIPAGAQPTEIVLDPRGRFAYGLNGGMSPVSMYTVDPMTGLLGTVHSPSPVAGSAPQSIAIDAGGQFMYIVNYTSNDVSAFAIDPSTGMLKPVSGGPFATGGTGGEDIAVWTSIN